jgi:hypothetical protein
MRRILFWFITLFIVLPIGLGAAQGYFAGWPQSWRTADWSSASLLPKAQDVEEAEVMILSTRTGRWKSIFAEHMSIVYKRETDTAWTRYDVVGWGNPVRKNAYDADAKWYGNTPRVIYKLTGDDAARIIPTIEDNIKAYPHTARGSYTVWPGPNSNTFVATIVRNTPGFDAELPAVAVGKDWIAPGFGMAPAPSKTGWTVSLAGVIGGTAALEEGLELHLLGSTIGLDFNDLALKLPALDKLSAKAYF